MSVSGAAIFNNILEGDNMRNAVPTLIEQAYAHGVYSDDQATNSFFAAFERGEYELAGEIIKTANFNVGDTNLTGDTPLLFVLRAAHAESSRVCTSGDEARQNFSEVTMAKVMELVEALVEGRSDLNYENENNLTKSTPVVLAALMGRGDLLGLLAAEGADLDLPNSEGLTPVMQAIKFTNLEAVKLLLNNGAENEVGEPSEYGGEEFFNGIVAPYFLEQPREQDMDEASESIDPASSDESFCSRASDEVSSLTVPTF